MNTPVLPSDVQSKITLLKERLSGADTAQEVHKILLEIVSLVPNNYDLGTLLREEINNWNNYDTCVMCGAETAYKRHTHIAFRRFYIEGVGQFCQKCYYK